jgi:hypothetical protein
MLLRVGVLLGVVLAAAALALPNVRWPLWGWLRGESFYREWPTSYYRETLKRPFADTGSNCWHFGAPTGYWAVIAEPSPLPLEGRPEVAAMYRRLGLTPRRRTVLMELADVDQVLPVLTELLRDDDPQVAANAARVLERMESWARPAVPALLDVFHRHEDVRVRRMAASAVWKIDRDLWFKVAEGRDPQTAAEAVGGRQGSAPSNQRDLGRF